jgi:hypothetical protein
MFLFRHWMIAVLLFIFSCISAPVYSHPGSGIVVTDNGDVYFIDTGAGVYKIGADGLTSFEGAPAFHWMAVDWTGRWRSAPLPYYPNGEFTVAGETPTLIMSSDVPVALSGDDFVYPQPRIDRRLEIIRWNLAGEKTVFAVLPAETEGGPLQWLHGLTAGPGKSLYYTENSSVRRINDDGSLSTIATQVSVADCVRPPGYDDFDTPGFRGLDVHSDGRVIVAATGCSALLALTPEGAASLLLRTETPWSPTAVAIKDDVLYVLEYFHKKGDDRREWTPRVRKISQDGKNEIIATIVR